MHHSFINKDSMGNFFIYHGHVRCFLIIVKRKNVRPLLLTEQALGQLVRKSSVKAMQAINRRTGGVGFAAVTFGAFIICAYYCVMLAWVWVYMFYTFYYIGHTYVVFFPRIFVSLPIVFFLRLPWAEDAVSFFNTNVLMKSNSITEITGFSWPVLLGLLLTWLVVFICTMAGTKSTAYVSYVTVPLPYVLVLILLIRGLCARNFTSCF